MKFNIIGSSSDGNCIIVEDFLMLDCGLTYSKIKNYLKGIKIIFISHVHSDHLKKTTIKKIVYDYPNIKFLCGSEDIVIKLVECGAKYKNIIYLKSNKWFDLGLFKVRLEELHHDVPNHLLKWEYMGLKGVYIIDTGNVNGIQAKSYDLFLIEANYKKDVLEKNKKKKDNNYEFDHLYRVEEAHLSYEQAMDFLVENMNNNSNYELLHKSKENFEYMEE